MQYPNSNRRNVILLSYNQFDPMHNKGTRKYKSYKITKVNLIKNICKFYSIYPNTLNHSSALLKISKKIKQEI